MNHYTPKLLHKPNEHTYILSINFTEIEAQKDEDESSLQHNQALFSLH